MVDLLERLEAQGKLPHTMALFGGWGMGKTATLASFYVRAAEKYRVIYFNAYKYAAFSEVFAALVYKLLENSSGNADQQNQRFMDVIGGIASRHRESAGKLVTPAF